MDGIAKLGGCSKFYEDGDDELMIGSVKGFDKVGKYNICFKVVLAAEVSEGFQCKIPALASYHGRCSKLIFCSMLAK